MKRMDLSVKEVSKTNYRVFKGYSVRITNRTRSVEEHFVVPWEMTHEDCKNAVYH